MDLARILSRAKRGLKEELRIYGVAIASISVAFLCLCSALLTMTNLSSMAERIGSRHRLTVYLKEFVAPKDVEQLKLALEGTRGVAQVTHVTSEQARQEFLAEAKLHADSSSLSAEVFPASLEAALTGELNRSELSSLTAKLRKFDAIDEIETYQTWFDRIGSLVMGARAVLMILALLVLACAVAVIGNTIRLAVANRRQEIEILKLCGATDRYVRGPFVVEGALQGFMSALVAIVLLAIGFLLFRSQVEAVLLPFTGGSLLFLPAYMTILLLLGGAGVGAVGSALSVRRYLQV